MEKKLSSPSNLKSDMHYQNFGSQSYDYDPWQRKVKTKATCMCHIKTQAPQKSTNISRSITDVKSKSNVSRDSHSHTNDKDEKQQTKERCHNMEVSIITAKENIQLLLKREKELVESNIQIIENIDNIEDTTHAEVKRLLRKYEKYRGGIALLNANFLGELSEAKEDLDRKKTFLDLQIRELEKKKEALDDMLKEKQNELAILSTYKDKEYPVKAMMLSNFQTELDTLKSSNKADQEELEHIINTELGKYEKEKVKIGNNVISKVIADSVSMMHNSIKDTALQNLVMKKEIEFHQKHQEEISQLIKQLESEVITLLKSPKSNLRLQLFPEFFPTREKCNPDMELTLDIPTQEWLPI